MAYHVACGLEGIYAGTLNPKLGGNGNRVWRNKSIVTDEAVDSVAQYMFNQLQLSKDFKGDKAASKIACEWVINDNGGKMRLICEYEPPQEVTDEASSFD